MVKGFVMLKEENMKSVLEHMASEGTCCLAYGDFVDRHVNMLLEGHDDLKKIRDSHPDDAELHEEWSDLDMEIIEFLIMARAAVNVTSMKLYWSSTSVSTEPFEDAEYGFDFN